MLLSWTILLIRSGFAFFYCIPINFFSTIKQKRLFSSSWKLCTKKNFSFILTVCINICLKLVKKHSQFDIKFRDVIMKTLKSCLSLSLMRVTPCLAIMALCSPRQLGNSRYNEIWEKLHKRFREDAKRINNNQIWSWNCLGHDWKERHQAGNIPKPKFLGNNQLFAKISLKC